MATDANAQRSVATAVLDTLQDALAREPEALVPELARMLARR